MQGPPGDESAGYHGYWVTDFTRPDGHFGTPAEFAAFVDAAHARGMKVYMDIITNHTADVITYADGNETNFEYRSLADYPYSTRGAASGEPINPGFMGHEDSSEENFARLTDPNYAYIPEVPEAEREVKVPAWLNDPIYYHNRGNSSFTGEDSRFGDFSGLDDLFTEHPRVRAGMIEIFCDWITQTRVDGFRIDTARHVDPGFWQTFVPAVEECSRKCRHPQFPHVRRSLQGRAAERLHRRIYPPRRAARRARFRLPGGDARIDRARSRHGGAGADVRWRRALRRRGGDAR